MMIIQNHKIYRGINFPQRPGQLCFVKYVFNMNCFRNLYSHKVVIVTCIHIGCHSNFYSHG